MFEIFETKEERLYNIKQKAAEYLWPLIPKCYDFYINQLKKDYNKSVESEIIQLAAFFHEITPAKENKQDFKITPDEYILSKEKLKKINPEIFRIRKELFGKKEAPFTWDEAIEWIEQNNKELNPVNITKLNSLKAKYLDIQHEIDKLDPISYSSEIKINLFPYLSKKGVRKEISVMKNSPLEKLYKTTCMLSRWTIFSELGLNMYALTGVHPPPIVYSIRKSRGVELKIYRRLSYEEYIKLFKDINNYLSPKRKKFTEKNQKIYNLIEKNGGKPKKNKMKFWENKWREWNKENPEDPYKSPDCLRISYLRIKDRLDNKNLLNARQ